MKKTKKITYDTPLIEVSERVCFSMFAESATVDSSEPDDWSEGNIDWWNS